jgi:hypothetical protein
VYQYFVGPSTPAESYSFITVPVKARCKQTIKAKTLNSAIRANSVFFEPLDLCPQFFYLPQAPDFLSTRPCNSLLFFYDDRLLIERIMRSDP